MTRLALALVLLLAAPSAASASKLSVVMADGCLGNVACTKYRGLPPVPITTFQAAPGEVNRVSVRRVGGLFLVRDEGAVVDVEAPCTRADDEHSAYCQLTLGSPGLPGFAALLGDGDDTLRFTGDLEVETSTTGGAGDDVIQGGRQNDAIDGGAGSDGMTGGGGLDELLYATRTAPVRVDLVAGTGGEAWERDRVGGFELLVGGRGDDVLRGAGRAETIDGGAGDDVLSGRGSYDTMFGGTGADRLLGGTDNDRLYGDPAQGDDVYTPIIRLRPDVLLGGRGDDFLFDTGGRNIFRGGPGADFLEGGAGPDRMDAGPGRDSVQARGGGRDRVRCGSGRDAAETDRRDARRSCELREIPPPPPESG